MNQSRVDSQSILDKALELALQSSWESFALGELADALNCTLADIRSCFRSKDDMAEALFDRVDLAMLEFTTQNDDKDQPSDERLLQVLMSWYGQLTPYKPLVREILAYKLEPGHFHLQAHGITRVSRTVQWIRDAAGREHTGLSRVVDEIAVTTTYLAGISSFLKDTSTNHVRTCDLLKRLIKTIDKGNRLLDGLSCPAQTTTKADHRN